MARRSSNGRSEAEAQAICKQSASDLDAKDDFDELWVLLRCATRQGSQTRASSGSYGLFFRRVTESEARDVVLDKLREFDLVQTNSTLKSCRTRSS